GCWEAPHRLRGAGPIPLPRPTRREAPPPGRTPAPPPGTRPPAPAAGRSRSGGATTARPPAPGRGVPPRAHGAVRDVGAGRAPNRPRPDRRQDHRAPASTGTRPRTTTPRGSARSRSGPRTQPRRPAPSRTTPTMRGRNPATTTATATAATPAEPRATDATHRPRPCATAGTTKGALGGTAAL